MFLDGGVNGWSWLLRNNPAGGIAVIDATAGSGYSKEGEDGSPIILNRHFSRYFSGRFRQLCCDKDKKNIADLQKIDLIDCDIRHGNYQDLVLPWLATLRYRPIFGLLYVDANGIIDVLNGDNLFQALRSQVIYERIDFAFNLSLNAYKRHKAPGVIDKIYHGAPPGWLMVNLIDHMDRLASFKRTNFIRTELGKLQEFVMLYGMQTDKVNLTRRNAGIIPYDEWRGNAESYLNGGLKVGVGQMRMDI